MSCAAGGQAHPHPSPTPRTLAFASASSFSCSSSMRSTSASAFSPNGESGKPMSDALPARDSEPHALRQLPVNSTAIRVPVQRPGARLRSRPGRWRGLWGVQRRDARPPPCSLAHTGRVGEVAVRARALEIKLAGHAHQCRLHADGWRAASEGAEGQRAVAGAHPAQVLRPAPRRTLARLDAQNSSPAGGTSCAV